MIGRPFSTCEKGKKHPRLRLTSLGKTTKRLKGRHHPGRPGRPGLQSFRGTESWRRHTHTPRAMCEKGGVEFFHWQYQCPIFNFLASAGLLCASNTRREWVRGQHSPIEYANHYTMNRYEKLSVILNQLLLLFHFHLFWFILFLSFRLLILHVTPVLYSAHEKSRARE